MIRTLPLALCCGVAAAELPADKVGHFAAGAAITSVVNIAHPYAYAPEAALGTTVLVAVGKEVYDRQHSDKHKAETNDALATILGGALVYSAIKTDRWAIRRRNKSYLLVYEIQR